MHLISPSWPRPSIGVQCGIMTLNNIGSFILCRRTYRPTTEEWLLSLYCNLSHNGKPNWNWPSWGVNIYMSRSCSPKDVKKHTQKTTIKQNTMWVSSVSGHDRQKYNEVTVRDSEMHVGWNTPQMQTYRFTCGSATHLTSYHLVAAAP